MDDTTKIRRLQAQRAAMREELALLRRVVAATPRSEAREGWMPEWVIEELEKIAARNPEEG